MRYKLIPTIAGLIIGVTSYSAHAKAVSAWGEAEHLNYDAAKDNAILNLGRRYPNVKKVRITECFRVTHPPAYKV
ncbi:hypothetical protein, partial [Pseudoalteromonas luteoviolacea]